MYYILDKNKNPVETDCLTMSNYLYLNNENKIIKRDEINDSLISTVFLGIDHNHFQIGSPILFETMIFSNDKILDNYCERYCTYDQALEGHKKIIEMVEKGEIK